MDQQESCVDCRFWQPGWKFKREQKLIETQATPGQNKSNHQHANLQNADIGLCRRYAPQASPLTTKWMETHAIDWCGDFESAAKNQIRKPVGEPTGEKIRTPVRN